MWNFISSAIGALAQNANTQDAINANKESQAENREWNLNLAKMLYAITCKYPLKVVKEQFSTLTLLIFAQNFTCRF